MEQAKRGIDEKAMYYKDQLDELVENVSKKASLVKQFQKKFAEVEIFVQRECKSPENIDKWGHWQTFTVVPFINKNEKLLKRKSYYDLLISKTANKALNLIDENKLLQMGEEPIQDNKLKKINIEEIETCYNNRITFLERKKEYFKIISEILCDKLDKEVIPSFVAMSVNEDKIETAPLNLIKTTENDLENEDEINDEGMIQIDN